MSEKNLITEKQLSSFPIKEIRIGTRIQRVRFDERTNRMYLLDEYGEYIGKSAIWTPPAPESTPEEQVEDEEFDETPLEIDIPFDKIDQQDEEPAQEIAKNEDADIEATPKNKRKRNPLILILALAGAGLILITAFLISLAKKSDKGEAEATTAPSNYTTVPTNTDPKDTTINTTEYTPDPTANTAVMIPLLIPKESIMPGQSLEDVSFDIAEVPENEYKILSALTVVYTDADMEKLHDMVAAKYIAAGKYLTDADLTTKYTPVNPWKDLEAGEASVTLPVTVESGCLLDYLWGNQVDIKITCKSNYSVPGTPETSDTQAPDGVSADSTVVESTIVTTYSFRGAVIRDVFDKNGESLFLEYDKRTLLPEGVLEEYLAKRYEDKDALNEDTPCQISVILTQEQYELFSTIDADDMIVEVEMVAASCENELQRDVYSKLQEVGQAVIKAISRVHEEVI